MNIEQFKEIIDFLPTLIIYVVPGYITIWILSFLYSIDIVNEKLILLKSIVLSYITINILILFGINPVDRTLGKVIIFISSILLSYIIYGVSNWSWLMEKLGFGRDFRPIMFDGIINTEDSTWLIVYIKEEKIIYKGKLRFYKKIKNDENYYLILSNFKSLTYKGKVVDDYTEEDEDKIVIINTKNASSIEIFGKNNLKSP